MTRERLTTRDIQVLIGALLIAATRADAKGKHKRASDMRALGCKLLRLKVAK